MIIDSPSPHYSSRSGNKVVAAIIHYTAGGDAIRTVNWFKNPAANVSSHFVIDRNGDIYRCVDLNMSAWHAGVGSMKIGMGSTKKINQKTIGIEVANYGLLHKDKDGCFWSKGGTSMREYVGPPPVYATHVIKESKAVTGWWEPFTKSQYRAIDEVLFYCEAEGYELDALWGHDEVALPVGRKIDPGPLFLWEKLDRTNKQLCRCHVDEV